MCNDHAYTEALFPTAKYCRLCPERPFDAPDEVRLEGNGIIAWYNHEHRQSAINYVTPNQRHTGKVDDLLAARAALYAKVRRFQHRRTLETVNTRLDHPYDVYLNPERSSRKTAEKYATQTLP